MALVYLLLTSSLQFYEHLWYSMTSLHEERCIRGAAGHYQTLDLSDPPWDCTHEIAITGTLRACYVMTELSSINLKKCSYAVLPYLDLVTAKSTWWLKTAMAGADYSLLVKHTWRKKKNVGVWLQFTRSGQQQAVQTEVPLHVTITRYPTIKNKAT